MDIQQIPKTFWHAVSLAVIVVSCGLTFIAYQASSVSIEIANAKITLSSEVATSQVALKSALDQARQAKLDVEQTYAELQSQYQQLQKIIAQAERNNNSERTSVNREVLEELKQKSTLPNDQLLFKNFEQSYDQAEQSLQQLQTLNQQIQLIK